MKKIIKPSSSEESVYYSDFSGKCFGDGEPPVILNLSFGYGSKYDGSELEFHLSDEDVVSILDVIKNKTSKDFNDGLKRELQKNDDRYDDHIQSRDWYGCESIGKSIDLLKDFLNK